MERKLGKGIMALFKFWTLLIITTIYAPLMPIDWTIKNESDSLIGVMVRDGTPGQQYRLLRLRPSQSGVLPSDTCPVKVQVNIIELDGTIEPAHHITVNCGGTTVSLMPKDSKKPHGEWVAKQSEK
jgi:hypothetical protein